MAALAYLMNESPVRPALLGALIGAAIAMRPTCVVLLWPLCVYLALSGQLNGWRSYAAAILGLGGVLLALAM